MSCSINTVFAISTEYVQYSSIDLQSHTDAKKKKKKKQESKKHMIFKPHIRMYEVASSIIIS